jgi:hypothetical protein
MQRRTSGPIRSALGPALKLLRQHLASAQVTMNSEISPENERELKNERKVITGVLNRVENQNQLWIEYINQLPADQIQAEQDLYDAFPPRPPPPAEGAPPQPEYKTLVEWIEQGRYMLDMIEAALEEDEDEQPAHVPILENARGPRRADAVATSHPRLPQIEVPKFSGDPAKWPQFWGLFENCIDSQPVTGIEKMSYLVSRLEGNAAKLVAGYMPTNKNYTTVVKLLKERYGDERVISEALQKELMNLPRPNDTVHSLRTFSDSVERICRQLKDHRIEGNNPFFVTAIRERLPESVLTKLVEKERAERRVWKFDDLREALGEVVTVMEDVNRIKGGSDSNRVKHVSPTPNVQNRPNQRFQTGTNRERTFVTLSGNPHCSLCFGGHFPSECPQYKNAFEKSARLKEQNRCVNCLRGNHEVKDCTSNRRCPNCGGKHHKMVCFKSQGNGQNNNFGRQNTNSTPPKLNFVPSNSNSNNANFVPINSKPSNSASKSAMAPTLVGISTLVKNEANYLNENCDEEKVDLYENFGKYGELKGQIEENEIENLKFDDNEKNLNNMKMDEGKWELEAENGKFMGMNEDLPIELDDGQLNELKNLENAEDLDGLVKQISALSYQNIQKLRKMDHAYYMTKKLTISSRRNPRHQLSAVVLCDGASGFNYITDQIVRRLHPPKIHQEKVEIHGVGAREPIKIRSPTYAVKIKRMDGEWEELELNWIKDFCSPFLTVEWKSNGEIPEMDEVELGNALNFSVEAPEIVISTRDMWRFIVGTKQVYHKVFAIMTVFGPMVAGESFVGPTQENPSPSLVAINAENIEQMPPANSVQEFWSLETIGITENNPEEEEADAERKFLQSIRRESNGRYVVKWPWRREKWELASNFRQAHSRLCSLVRKEDLLEKIDGYYKDWMNRGIIEISDFSTNKLEHFLPHHAVITSKLRMVHDASSHEKNELSLNDCLYKGLNQLPKIASILLRSRSTEILLTADVEKAFTCVGLDEGERDFCKFLWLKDFKKPLTNENLLIYRFARVGFGITCAPYMLSGVIKVHLEKHFPELAERFLENNYVDNLAMMCQNSQEAMEMYKKSKEAFAGAQMNLREYTTNSVIAREMIPKDECIQDELVKFLGIKWNTHRDSFIFEFPDVPASRAPTRRVVLSVMAGHYDPLGLTGPAMLYAKILFQKLWGEKSNWDSPLIGEEKANWMFILDHWRGQKIEIPRYFLFQNSENVGVHAFVDASDCSFAAAIYIVCGPMENRNSSLVFSKNRLKPAKRAKTLTIHKLELFGILLGIRTLKFVMEEMKVDSKDIHLWSDSQVALAWLRTKEPQPAIIDRRIKEIRTLENCVFHYVRTKQNPADMATRGTTPEGLRNSNMWWKGPEWLTDKSLWPNEIEFELKGDDEEKIPTMMTDEVFVGIGGILGKNEWLIDPEKYSAWYKLINVVENCLKFILKIGNEKMWQNPIFKWFMSHKDGIDSVPNRRKCAEYIFMNQAQKFEWENLKKYDVYEDELGMLRLHTRMGNSDCNYEQKFPLVLPKSAVTFLKLREIHVKLCHAGVETTLTEFLSQFWSPQARKQTRQMVKKCLQCRRAHSAQFALPRMPPHPSRRTRASAPFLHIGVDYAGPTLTRLPEGNIVKVWLVLITCLMTRAVYIEPTLDMTTDSFLNVFRRFVARRGRPETCLSDNGSQFVLANKTIQLLTDGTKGEIKWRFLPALSPWAGGVYERLIKLAKDGFRRSLGRLILPFDELLSFCAEIEFSMNSRPITYVSDAAGEPRPLRPIDFIHPKGIHSIEIIDRDFFEIEKRSPQNRLAAEFQSNVESLEMFFDRWRKEYLNVLRERSKWNHVGPARLTKREPKLGEIVLIREDHISRNNWPMGKIIELEGKEGAIRSVKLKLTSGKIWVRPVSRLHPLETDLDDGRETESTNVEREKVNENFRVAKEITVLAPEKVGENKHGMVTRAKAKLGMASISLISLIFLSIFGILNCSPIKFTNMSDCRGCLVQCSENGIHALVPRPFEKAEICCQDLCVVRTHVDKIDFNLPTEILLNKFSCEIKFWKNNAPNPHEKSIKCEALHECQVLKCSWCLDLILNPFCSPKMAIFVFGTLLLFGYFAICCLARTMKCCSSKLRHLCSAIIYILAVPVSLWKWLRWGKPIDPNAARQTVKQKIRNIKKGVAKTSLNWRQRSLKAAGLIIVLFMVFDNSNAKLLDKLNDERNEQIRNERQWKLETFSKYDLVLVLILGIALIYLGWIFVILEERVMEEMENERRELMRIERIRRRYQRRDRRVHWAIVLLLLMASPQVGAFSNIVSIVSQSQHCSQNGQEMICKLSSSNTLTLLPMGQTNVMLINDETNGTLGTLSVIMHKLTKKCSAKIKRFTRSYEMDVEVKRRCPGAGNCQWGSCEELGKESLVDEMENNHLPGHTFCQHVPSQSSDLCPLGVPIVQMITGPQSCLFYRQFARPKGDNVYKILECTDWENVLKAEATLEIDGKVQSHSMWLQAAQKHRWNTISFTPLSITSTDPISMRQKFLLGKDGVAVLPEKTQWGDLFCENKERANNFDCQIALEACQDCQIGQTSVKCNCRGFDGEEIMGNIENSLPLSMGNHRLYSEKDEIFVEQEYSAVQLNVDIEGLELVHKSQQAECRIEVEELQGCYQCATGAELKAKCWSDGPKFMASVECAELQFVLHCSKEGEQNTAIIPSNAEKFEKKCIAKCPSNSVELQLKGQLYYVPPKFNEILKQKIVGENAGGEGQNWGSYAENTVESVKGLLDFSFDPFILFSKFFSLAKYGFLILIFLLFAFLAIAVIVKMNPIGKVVRALLRTLILWSIIDLLANAERKEGQLPLAPFGVNCSGPRTRGGAMDKNVNELNAHPIRPNSFIKSFHHSHSISHSILFTNNSIINFLYGKSFPFSFNQKYYLYISFVVLDFGQMSHSSSEKLDYDETESVFAKGEWSDASSESTRDEEEDGEKRGEGNVTTESSEPRKCIEHSAENDMEECQNENRKNESENGKGESRIGENENENKVPKSDSRMEENDVKDPRKGVPSPASSPAPPMNLKLPRFALVERREKVKERMNQNLVNEYAGSEYWEWQKREGDWKRKLLEKRQRDCKLNRAEVFHGASNTVEQWRSDLYEIRNTNAYHDNSTAEERVRKLKYELFAINGERMLKRALENVIRSMSNSEGKKLELIPPEGLQLVIPKLKYTPGIVSDKRKYPPIDWINPQDVDERNDLKLLEEQKGLKPEERKDKLPPYCRYWNKNGERGERERMKKILDDDERREVRRRQRKRRMEEDDARRNEKKRDEEDEVRKTEKKRKEEDEEKGRIQAMVPPASPPPEEYEPNQLKIWVDEDRIREWVEGVKPESELVESEKGDVEMKSEYIEEKCVGNVSLKVEENKGQRAGAKLVQNVKKENVMIKLELGGNEGIVGKIVGIGGNDLKDVKLEKDDEKGMRENEKGSGKVKEGDENVIKKYLLDRWHTVEEQLIAKMLEKKNVEQQIQDLTQQISELPNDANGAVIKEYLMKRKEKLEEELREMKIWVQNYERQLVALEEQIKELK